MMYDNNGAWAQNKDGTWSTAVPLPLYGLMKKCICGKSFLKESNYTAHYIKEHTDGKRYNRTPKGLAAQQ